MKLATVLFACFLVFTQTPAAAESGLFRNGAATARIDFKITIPHTLRLRLTPLATSAGAMIRASAGALEDARMYAVSVMSTYGHVIIPAALDDQARILPPRSRAGLTQYRGVVTQAHSSSPEMTRAVNREPSGFTTRRIFVAAAP